jgi:pyruvate ferredoxin oxidoreductase beta subunit/2-oxoisovalerate ferredoxin oxidoreductase beta subunit
MSLGLQWLDEALGDRMPTLVIPASCAIVTPGAFPASAYGVPTIATTFASAAAVASGIARVRRLNRESDPTICWAGDGGTYDIGLATLSAAAERDEDVLYICYDNEIYGNTGGQRSSATPRGKREAKKDIVAIMSAHSIPYAATLSLAHRDDFLRKIRLALGMRGFRFLLMLSPCPAAWKSEPAESVELVRLAVDCGLFAVYEVFDGQRYRINVRPDGTPIENYVRRQGRFRTVAPSLDDLRAQVQREWARLNELARAFPAPAEPA